MTAELTSGWTGYQLGRSQVPYDSVTDEVSLWSKITGPVQHAFQETRCKERDCGCLKLAAVWSLASLPISRNQSFLVHHEMLRGPRTVSWPW